MGLSRFSVITTEIVISARRAEQLLIMTFEPVSFYIKASHFDLNRYNCTSN